MLEHFVEFVVKLIKIGQHHTVCVCWYVRDVLPHRIHSFYLVIFNFLTNAVKSLYNTSGSSMAAK